MKKIFGLAALISFITGGATSILTFRGWLNTPPQAISQPVVSASATPNLQKSTLFADRDRPIVADTQTLSRFQRVMQSAVKQKLSDRPMGEIIQAIAQQFLGAQYKKNLLDQFPQETLFISLDKFDCVLFVETVLAIARGVAVQDYDYDTFVDRVQNERYRNGELGNYCSRLHYFSEWIFDNQKRNNVENITASLGGITLNKNINYMSANRQTYPQIAKDDLTYQCFLEMEKNLSQLTIKYIPQNQIRRVYTQLQPGDIVAVATSIKGLDVTHTGLVYKNPNGNLGIIHASPAGTVRIASDLQGYVGNIPNAIGMIVTRPKDPRPN